MSNFSDSLLWAGKYCLLICAPQEKLDRGTFEMLWKNHVAVVVVEVYLFTF